MEAILILAVMAFVVIWIINGSRRKPTTKRTDALKQAKRETDQAKQAWLADIAEWLPQRWERAAQEKASGDLKEFPPWYYDDATERQQARLADIKQMGVFKMEGKLTKGQASDLIGLFEEPDDHELAVLKFFKIPTRSVSQTKARIEVTRLFSDPANREAWDRRPPTAMQKEFYHLFELLLPKSMTHDEMKADIDRRLSEMDGEEAVTFDASDTWDAYESIYTELNEPEFRRDMDLKKVSLKIYREFMLKKKVAGVRFSDLDANDVADELVEDRPELSRL